MTVRTVSVSVLACVCGLALAAGGWGCGEAKPPLVPDNTSQDSGLEALGEGSATGAAETDAGGKPPGAATSATPSAAGAPGAATPAPSPEPKDECTPVGVDFEKRARPKMRECYGAAKKKDPNLQGAVKISVDIDMLGKIKGHKIIEKTLPEAVAQCMLKAVKATPLTDAPKCPGKSLTIPIAFPTPP